LLKPADGELGRPIGRNFSILFFLLVFLFKARVMHMVLSIYAIVILLFEINKN